MKKIKLFLFPILMLFAIGISAQNIVYVDVDQTRAIADGQSWATAFPALQDGINRAGAGDQVWVKKGKYLPTEYYGSGMQLVQREKSFILKTGVSIYGGFIGTESSLSQRVLIDTNKTILSGDLYNGDSTRFAYHVVIGIGVNKLTLDGLTIQQGNANGTGNDAVNGFPIPKNAGGGMTFFRSTDMNFYNIEVTRNYATESGGGMNFEGTQTLEFKNVSFTNNILHGINDKSGGAALRLIYANAITIDSVEFINNGIYKTQGGGALRIEENSSATIKNSTFEDNYAFDEEDGGGAVYILEAEVDFSDVTFFNNHGGEAGAVYNDNAKSIYTNILFENNSSRDGGGGAMENDASEVSYINVVFKGNTSDGEGGALQNWKSELKFTDVLFEDNSADENGGAISNWTECNLFMNNTIFTGNTSGENGGAIYSGGGKCEVVSTNGLYYLNHAGISGGALYTEDHSRGSSSVILTNVTISKNSADTSAGGGFDDGAGNTQVRNSIIHGNTAPRATDVEVPQAMALTSVHYSIFEDQFHVGGGIYSTFTAQVFADTATNDFTLARLSPAINSGDKSFYDANKTPDLSSITTDIDGASRIQGDSIDLGAYETCGNIDTSSVAISSNIPANNEDTVTFTATATNGGNNPVFTWYKNSVVINGETADEYRAVAGVDIVNHDVIAVSVATDGACTVDEGIRDSIVIVITGINKFKNSEAKFNIYPNPSNGSFTLDYNGNNTISSFIVRDLTGRKVYSEESINSSYFGKEFNLELSNGLYFFTLINEKGEQETLKFIIKK